MSWPVAGGRLAGLAALLAGVILLGGATARADDRELARELFEQGTTALRDGRVEEGRDLLRESLELFPNLPTRFNLAVALRRAGDLLDAIELLEALAAGEHGRLSEEQHAEVARQLEQARSELPTLRVSVRGVPTASVRVDGQLAGSVSGSTLDVPVDPGTHVVQASADGYEDASQTVSAGRGDRVAVVLRPRAVVPSPEHVARAEQAAALEAERGAEPALEASVDDEGPPWGWIAVGAAVLAGAVVGTVLLVGGGTAEPVRDPVTGLAITLR